MELLRESLHSKFSHDDLEFQKQSMIFEHEDKMNDPDLFVPEKLFETGKGENVCRWVIVNYHQRYFWTAESSVGS